MNKLLKWIFIACASVAVLMVLAILLLPRFVEINKYRPLIEERVTKATGRPFVLGGELDLSLFPWVGVALSDLSLGNPEGFTGKAFVTVERFEVRVKLLPLLSKSVQVKKFVVESPRVFLEKKKNGQANWIMAQPGSPPTPPQTTEKRPAPKEEPASALPVKALSVDQFAITNGLVRYRDHGQDLEKELSGITLTLADLSLENPIRLKFSALADGHPVALDGKVGPIGKEPGKGTIPLDITLTALEEITMTVKGAVADPVRTTNFDLTLALSPFSPKNLMASLGMPFPVATADPKVLERLSLTMILKGDPGKIDVSGGVLGLDDSTLNFSARAREFSKPDLAFDVDLDRINLDRYLPPASPKEDKPTSPTTPPPAKPAPGAKTDYTPLRKLVLDGSVKIGTLVANRAKLEKIQMKIRGKNGRFDINPLGLNLYQGSIASRAGLDVRTDTPKVTLNLQAKGIASGPLLTDVLEKEIIHGTLESNLKISFKGETPDTVKKNLNGKGYLKFMDGAIVGIDIPGMVRNVKASFGVGETPTAKPRTDFAELHVPFTITNGLVNTPGTTLASPLLRVTAKGKTDLVKETLDMRVEPKFVATLKGQGDTEERAGIMVPVLISGTFARPRFSPDLKSMVKSVLPAEKELKKIIKNGKIDKDQLKKTEDRIKDLFKEFRLK
ncbi:MAG: AsmA family protein [Desulfobacteraceae bacterium]|nr:AsmA family protein [Desulfobacteraceae bacterium]